MGYSIDATSANCYEGTSCLINKFGIKDDKKLAALESDITFAKAAVLESQSPKLPFDFEYYKYIHRFLFEDIYDWAGQLRTVNISKEGTVFCSVDELENLCIKCFERLKQNNYFLNLPKSEFVNQIVDFYITTNMLHPFREGNGRTQRIFISKLIEYNGYDFDFSMIDSDEIMVATINASNGVSDGLLKIFTKEIK